MVVKVKQELEIVTKNLVSTLIFVEIKADPKFSKHIVGKNGANVTRLKNEFNVLINITASDGVTTIHIEGHKEGVEKARQVNWRLVHFYST